MSPNGFDRVARPYRWMEFLTFGRALEQRRFYFLPRLTDVRSALVLGDGDGRFTARLLRSAPHAHVYALDASKAMLALLRERGAAIGAGDRVTTQQADLGQGLPPVLAEESFDLVATHFFLDCLSTEQAAALIQQITPLLASDGRWIVSEFDVPQGRMHLPARLLVRLLYLAFRLLTGLRTQRLPAYRDALEQNGYRLQTRETALAGLLVSEMWAAPLPGPPRPAS